MGKNTAEDNNGCPHFDHGMHSCGLYSEGLYMPLRRHVAEFCMSRRHRECSLYAARSEPGKGAPSREGGFAMRDWRRHPRIAQEKSVTLWICDEQGNVLDGFVETAVTVDLSQAGMRVKTTRRLPAEKPLVYAFNSDFFIPFVRGMALVCWQKQTPGDPSGIEAGLVFYDSSIRALLTHRFTD